MSHTPDTAAVFAAAWSLHEACNDQANAAPSINLSASYQGQDGFFRELMRVAELFEKWACKHVEFAHMTDTWPYLLKARFGSACLETMNVDAFASFDETDCLRVAIKLRLPIRVDDHLPVPVCVEAANPNVGAKFARLRIQTVRADLEGGDAFPYSEVDEPFDEDYGEPFFGIYGVLANGKREHIADRPNYSAARNLLLALITNIDLPKVPIAFGRDLDVQAAHQTRRPSAATVSRNA